MSTRNTTTRDRHRAIIRRTRPPCHLCGQPINYQLKWPDPGCFVVDHIIPLNRGGADTIENKAASHRSCNLAKSDALPEDYAPRVFVTSRTW